MGAEAGPKILGSKLSKETSKCYAKRRERGDFRRYLFGNGIDIGAGDDPLIVEEGSVRAYDKLDGDAQYLEGIADDSFGFVYSSHCLEHMRDVPLALKNWIRVLKPGGALYVVVPDFELYEKGVWPSRFNPDHKATFSMLRPRSSNTKTHYYLPELVKWLDREAGLNVMEVHREDDGFDLRRFEVDQTETRHGGALCQIYFVGIKRLI